MTLLDALLIIIGITFMFPIVCFALSLILYIGVAIFGGKN